MDAHQAILLNIETANQICMGYLGDLTDEELLKRPCPGCNHINWQVGHLIASEHQMMESISPGSMPKLPEGFAEKYKKETAQDDNPGHFHTKADLLSNGAAVRKGTLAALAKMTADDLDKPTGVEYAPNVAAMFNLQGCHWLMHAGQWAVVRRQCGRAPLF